ncbi:hypothetical protein GCM10010168_86160 [Actinoplanes ianthinogenes]|uniref:Uncharacterized protein n=1 Tax=Actinoplanes ianthinogenes TaxID=122358 RepID=A0ABN6CK44_9ACTN|nr:hypothetical protein [Actinoplanes ianthinogenes]BCJ45347.1 hypothetical protein Aiant_60040 [Actinoplanes ianthinogenes]GGR53931.1 hypothetical protein GCM10010168_86160 [Actinoplanes ianthinogenes]
MTAVKLKGTFSKNERDSNGLEDIAPDLVKNEFGRYVVVGIVEQHKVTKEPGEAPIPTARFVAIEVARDADEAMARGILDRARKSRGLADLADTLFNAPRESYDFDGGEGGRAPAELDGQMEMRLGPDGEHQVPEASGEEILAEREEAKAAGVPAAEFSGGTE